MTNAISSRQNAIFQRVRNAVTDHDAEVAVESAVENGGAAGGCRDECQVGQHAGVQSLHRVGQRQLGQRFGVDQYRGGGDRESVIHRPGEGDAEGVAARGPLGL